MRVDLHIHTTASDGAWSAEAVVRACASGGLDLIAIADHDTAAASPAAAEIGREVQVQVIPAIEVSSTWPGGDIHILGYFVDLESEALLAHARRAKARRAERMHEMIERLALQGIDIAYEAVEAAAGPDRVNIGRPHLAHALVEAGYASSVPDSFNRLIGDRADAFVGTHMLDPVGAVELITASGGVSVWAHPPGDAIDPLLPELVRAGLGGLEVYRPSHKRNDVLRLEGICRSAGLLMGGGSDWHTPAAGSSLGDFFVEGSEIGALLARGGI